MVSIKKESQEEVVKIKRYRITTTPSKSQVPKDKTSISQRGKVSLVTVLQSEDGKQPIEVTILLSISLLIVTIYMFITQR